MAEMAGSTRRSALSLLALNFFLADVQTGLGPFLAAYLAASGWNPRGVCSRLKRRDSRSYFEGVGILKKADSSLRSE